MIYKIIINENICMVFHCQKLMGVCFNPHSQAMFVPCNKTATFGKQSLIKYQLLSVFDR